MSSPMPSNATNSAVANPYSPPRAEVDDVDSADGETYVPKFFSTSGRLGRVRFMLYGMGNYLLFIGLVTAITTVLARTLGTDAILAAMAPAYIGFFVATVFLHRRRCHDLDWSGWLGLLMFVPLVNFVFLLLPGTRGPNRYGPPPAPNGKLTAVAVIGLVGIVVLGILAAIAIPQYQDYVKRARAASAAPL